MNINIENQIKSQFVYNSLPIWVKWFFYLLDVAYSFEVRQLKKRLWAKEKPLKKAIVDEEKNNCQYDTQEKQKWAVKRSLRKLQGISNQTENEYDKAINILTNKYNNIKKQWIKIK